jgi:hypothetical protein
MPYFRRPKMQMGRKQVGDRSICGSGYRHAQIRGSKKERRPTMNQINEDPFGITSMVNTWMKAMGTLWENAPGQKDASQSQQKAGTTAGNSANPKAQAAMAARP